MIVDARTIGSNSSFETDICIVGGGTAGIALAGEFIGAPFRVVLLESGGKDSDYQTQSLYHGDNVGQPYYPLDMTRARYFGGSSTRWHVPIGGERLGARIRPLDPIDFEERDWVPHSGWPFDKAHLDPFLDRAQAICRVGPPSFEVADWEDAKQRPQLPFRGGVAETIIYKFACRDPFVREYPRGVTRADNITTVLHANVLEIVTNRTADHVSALRVGTLEGSRFTVSARHFVLAAGGIEIPRLLLLSNRVQSAGLGNHHDLVGRFFMEHPHFWSGYFVPRHPGVSDKLALYDGVHVVNGVPIVGKLALTESVLRREKLLNHNIQIIPNVMPDPFRFHPIRSEGVASFKMVARALIEGKLPDEMSRHLRNIGMGLGEIARAGTRKIRRTLNALPMRPVYHVANMIEQVPNPESRVTLGPERDAFGQQRVRLNWKITAQDIRSAVRTQEILDQELQRAGVGRLYRELRGETPPVSTHGGHHHMGTTRMHPDPKLGVVDENCCLHGVGNLFVAGPSVFPTGGYANPVLTFMALTLRMADHLKLLMAESPLHEVLAHKM